MLVSLDGYVEGPNGELAWSQPGPELHKHFNDLYLNGEFDTSIYGRKMYELLSAYWPGRESDPDATEIEREFSKAWKNLNKVVYSKTLDKVEWNSELKRVLNPDEIRQLKSKSGGHIDISGATLAAEFIKQKLVDEFWLYIHPVILGNGKPMFPPGHNVQLSVINSQYFPCGVVLLRYKFIK
jgi:dihydrofolate reductase